MNTSLSEGNLFKQIFCFSVPLILSNLLQVLFNMSDIAVVGRFAGSFALGSVGSTAQLVFLFTGIIIGIGSGVNVIVAFYLGAKNQKDVTETIQSSLAICLISGIALMVIGVILAKPVLFFMKTKSELIGDATIYFKIYMTGMPALALYNFSAAVLSAYGDTRRPLAFLSIAGVLNVALNLFFVIVLKMSVRGVALASVISQYVCAVLSVATLLLEKSEIHLSLKKIKLNPHKTSKILRLGLPAGLQNAVFAFANVFIQVGVNSFDAVMVAGTAAASNADPFAYEIMGAFYTACATFIGQNYGAANKKRVLKSYLISMFYAFGFGLLIGFGIFAFGKQFLSIFTTDKAVIDCGLQRILIMSFSYCIAPFMDCTIAASRGLGKTAVPSVFVILGSCVFRILWIQTVFAYFKTIPSLFLLYIFSWTITAIAEIVYFVKVYRETFERHTD